MEIHFEWRCSDKISNLFKSRKNVFVLFNLLKFGTLIKWKSNYSSNNRWRSEIVSLVISSFFRSIEVKFVQTIDGCKVYSLEFIQQILRSIWNKTIHSVPQDWNRLEGKLRSCFWFKTLYFLYFATIIPFEFSLSIYLIWDAFISVNLSRWVFSVNEYTKMINSK